ncbi:MAG TPA: PH domain-containing protein [Actinomycetota bacterium]|nr:PH domain-containing protein [Actinomycetota bacterium]
MWWTSWAAVVIVGALVAAPVADGAEAFAAYWGGLGVAIVLAFAVPYLRYRRWRYEIRERDLFLSHGSWFFVLTLIPFDRIQYVETHQGPLDLTFGLMQLVVYTAAGRAARIPGLAPAEAEALREELAKVAGTESV